MNPMELNDTQKQAIIEWAKDGCTLTELQNRINEEFHMSLTFMEVRLLVLDLGIEIRDSGKAVSAEDIDLGETGPGGGAQRHADEGMGRGHVSVEIDRVKKPGAVVNGTVTFSDGVSAAWSLDHAGRLGLEGVPQGYRPGEKDLQAFQEELGRLIQDRGF